MTALRDAAYERCVAGSQTARQDTPTAGAQTDNRAATGLPSTRGACCLLRLQYGHGWCLLPTGHEGMCIGRVSEEPENDDCGPKRVMSWGK